MAVLADSEVNQQVYSDGCSVIVSLQRLSRSLSMQMAMKRLSTSSNNERQTKNYGDLPVTQPTSSSSHLDSLCRAKCAEFLLFCIKFFKADTKLVRLFGDHRVKQLHKMMSIRRDEQLRENLHAFIEGFESGQS